MGNWSRAPWYALAAGVLGLMLISAFAIAVPRLGAAGTATMVILGQLLVGITLDHFGFLVPDIRSIDAYRVAGVGLVLVGTYLVVR